MSEVTGFADQGPLERRLPSAAVSLRDRRVTALLALACTTGIVDASSFLGLGRVFTANQTGNIVLLAAGIAGTGNLPVVAPLVSLGAFVVGAGAAGVVTKHTGERRRMLVGRGLAIETLMLAAAAILAAAVADTPGSVSAYIVIALLALAMGARTGTVARFGGPDQTLTMLTGTLAALAANLPFTGGSGMASVRRLAATSALFSGALVGALALKTSLWLPLGAAAGLALVTWVIYAPAIPRHR